MNEMGQMLFEPPSVAGWDWGPAWLSTNTTNRLLCTKGRHDRYGMVARLRVRR